MPFEASKQRQLLQRQHQPLQDQACRTSHAFKALVVGERKHLGKFMELDHFFFKLCPSQAVSMQSCDKKGFQDLHQGFAISVEAKKLGF